MLPALKCATLHCNVTSGGRRCTRIWVAGMIDSANVVCDETGEAEGVRTGATRIFLAHNNGKSVGKYFFSVNTCCYFFTIYIYWYVLQLTYGDFLTRQLWRHFFKINIYGHSKQPTLWLLFENCVYERQLIVNPNITRIHWYRTLR